MEKSSDLESQLAKVEENLVSILESINKGKEEAKFPEGKKLDVEVRLDFIEKLARKIKVVAFKDKDEINPQLLPKKLSKLRIDDSPPEVEKQEIKLDKRRFEEFELKFEKQLEDQQKLNEELKKELGQVKQKQRKIDQYLGTNNKPLRVGNNNNNIPKSSVNGANPVRPRHQVLPKTSVDHQMIRFRAVDMTTREVRKQLIIPFEPDTRQIPQQMSLFQHENPEALVMIDAVDAEYIDMQGRASRVTCKGEGQV
ncbi:hypothetical protein COLO4_26997 [Corchorus olitorius]|uniref:Uncharacterized protein n=1 Tax=Corchorus olitorius TaxID=93759 RepID=A0A1R3HTL7_9ROSI|nr:hypothetical protein COLO4_26997 [Corchorus olitorius]